MKATLLLVLLACLASRTFALPVRHDGEITVTSGVSTASDSITDEIRVHIFDSPRHDVLGTREGSRTEFERNTTRTTSNWAERSRRVLRRIQSFYRVNYPPKVQSSSTKQSTIIVDMTSGRNFTSPPSNPAWASTDAFRGKSFAEQFLLNVSRMNLVILCHEYSPEIIGIVIFLLVPAAVLIVEGMDKVRGRWTPERFPQRGRGRVRLTGHERQLSVLAAYEREKLVKELAQKCWRHRRRSTPSSRT